MAHGAGLRAAGVQVNRAAAVTTLRKTDQPMVIDGPFAETKEQLLGFYVIDVADLGEALAMIEPLAAQLPGYFYFFGAKGAFLLQMGRAAEARGAFDQAIALVNTAPEAAHIRRRLDRLTETGAIGS